MSKPIAININLSTSGRRLGGAAIASEFHCAHMAAQYPIELWRMWDGDGTYANGALPVRNFKSYTPLRAIESKLPRRLRSCLLDSDIGHNLTAIQPGIVHLHNPVPSFAFERLARHATQLGSKVVVTTHGFFEVMNPNYNFKSHEKWLWRQIVTKPVLRSLRHMDALLTLYPGERQTLTALGVPDSKIHLIPNGVNPFFLSPPMPADLAAVQQKFQLNPEKPILLFIGNHTANKGIDTVMRVAHELSQPATIVVGGKLLSPDEPQQWQAKLPAAADVDVVFTDYLSLEEQRALYHLAALLLFPSLSDTLPLTIIEAMACGLTTVAYDVGGIAYQLAEESGVVVPPEQFGAFHQAVQGLLANGAQRQQFGSNARSRQQQLFSWQVAADKTIHIYETLLSF
jgi:alpha-maltose-1-phosphate synthase